MIYLSFSPFRRTIGVFLSTEKGSRAISQPKKREREDRGAGASYWFSWNTVISKVTIASTYTGVSPVANRSSTADKVLARFLLWSRQVGKDFASSLSVRDRNANDLFEHCSLVNERFRMELYLCKGIREFLCNCEFRTISERLVSARAYIYIFIWLKWIFKWDFFFTYLPKPYIFIFIKIILLSLVRLHIRYLMRFVPVCLSGRASTSK